ncbi:SMC family ATPase [Chryseobacterium sp. SNU WT5]|uniref:AAA family ATPase n=1 Tax=Chryseobacterium sp. SNU WT5 TaxID=2594269 RepID=UPI00117DCFFC|nr:SMC family ATPase [Chryseobacterium sp. SNU WT5]QDP84544.1 SMC family ATPase [Chryseobacterium sp. SNU WT5]
MIPVQLILEGLYSYQERQTIDFQRLTDAGLFGIFGSVGSGKSSILEAITFALYGETERLNSRDKRAYNMMNLKSNRSYIAFDFINFENKKFRATREFKRNSKNFEDVKTPNVIFYEWKDEKWIPQERSNTEEIIGLSYANFKRTIIIPQGQFKEFIELGATERTNMMKEIFSLQRFDLQNNVSALNEKNKTELHLLEGQLKGFETITEEQIQLQKENLKIETSNYLEVEIGFKKIEKHYQQLKNLKTDFEILNQKKEAFEKLSEQKEKMDLLSAQTERFDNVFKLFNPLILEKSKLQKEIETQKNNKETQEKILKEIVTEFSTINEALKIIVPKYEALNDSKIQEHDLGLIVQMLQFSEEIKLLQERTKHGAETVQEVDQKQKGIADKIKILNEKIKALKPQKLDSNLLVAVEKWFSEQKKLKENQNIHTKKIRELQLKINAISTDLEPFKINIETFKNDFKEKNDALEVQHKQLSDKKNQLEVQQQLAHFSNQLHDGESCPLCGALEHPNIVTFEDVQSELNHLGKLIENTENQKKDLQQQVMEIEKILYQKNTFEEQLGTEQEKLKLVKVQLDKHQQSFTWKEFNSENETEFDQRRQKSFSIEEQIEELNQEVSTEQKNLEKERGNFDKFNKALETFKLEEAQKATQIQTNWTNLKILNWDNYQDQNIAEVQKIYEDLSKINLETEKNYQHFIAKEKQVAPKLAAQKAGLQHLEKSILAIKKEIADNEKLLKESLIAEKFADLKEVEFILGQQINVVESRKIVENFTVEFKTLKNGITELTSKLKDFSFDQEEFSTLETQFETAEKKLKTANNIVVKTTSEIERLEKEFKKKEALLKDLGKIQKRADDLKVMFNLFKAAGFVQFVSSIYLRKLCDHANERFHRMTRNQLSLQLNENNDFEIIDYLNEGKCRSVKTLSGGQAFQVSLSLALALAESVQSNAQADKNFFFIDEGFGTQDLESVNVVFETLTNLQKENRIVGIISHVEELKEKMPVSLNITKDEERGSLIEVV